jgi:hypothetical protein
LNDGVSIWDVLGIAVTTDEREIRRAYARKLKVTPPEDDAEGFQQLRMAYEYALGWVAHVAQSGQQERPPDPTPESACASPQPAPSPTPSVLEVEKQNDLRAAKALFDTLSTRIAKNASEGWPDVDGDQRALASLLRSSALQRIDLQLQIEEAVASMLVHFIPHSDHVLSAAARHFEWEARQHESSLPPQARAVLARLNDLAFLEFLRTANNEASRAYETLKKRTSRWQRWWMAFESHTSEVALLRQIEANHPGLLQDIPAENVEWFSTVERLPRPSTALILMGVIAIVIAMLNVGVGNADQPDVAERVMQTMFLGFAIAFGVLLFDYFVLKLPPMLVEERWQGRLPVRLSLAWLPPSLLVAFGVTVPNAPSMASHGILALGIVASYLALVVSGRVPKIQWRGGDLTSVRPVQVFLLNAMMLAWLLAITKPLQLNFEVVVAITLVLVGSGVSRPGFIRLVAQIAPRVRMSLAITGLLLAFALLAAAWMFGRIDAIKPWLVAAVVVLVLLRRAIPHGIAINDNKWAAGIVVVVGWLAVSLLRDEFQLELKPQEYGEPPVLVSGAMFFLGGAAYAFGRAIHDAAREMRAAT